MNPDMALPSIQPKGTIGDPLIMSKIHISKNWKLPPRNSGYTRKRTISNTYDNDNGGGRGCSSGSDDPEDRSKKQRQNRDAQRAYRERKANRMMELEENIESLQELVKYWKSQCLLKDKMISKLKAKMDSSSKLDELLNNFKPMKPVAIPRKKTMKKKILNNQNSDTCGFCENPDSCVCKDLESETRDIVATDRVDASQVVAPHCSSNPDTCTKCSNIDETCIKPVTASKSAMFPKEDEIDFTFLDNGAHEKIRKRIHKDNC